MLKQNFGKGGCLCMDCGCETMQHGNDFDDWYMVHDNVWKQAVPEFEPTPQYADLNKCEFLCLDCLEKRIKRKLTKHDFTDCEANKNNKKVQQRYLTRG
jgi:hypothetical protein